MPITDDITAIGFLFCEYFRVFSTYYRCMKKYCKSLYIITVFVCLLFAMGAAKAPIERTDALYPSLVVEYDGGKYIYKDKPVTPSDFTVIEQIA